MKLKRKHGSIIKKLYHQSLGIFTRIRKIQLSANFRQNYKFYTEIQSVRRKLRDTITKISFHGN